MLVAILITSGIVALATGGLLLTKPNAVIRLSEIGNKVVTTDHFAFVHRRPIGGLLLILGAFFLLCGATAFFS